MDFLDPAKKRAHNRRLFIGYFLVGVAILMASIVLIFLTNGYDVDRKTGQVIQNGLIFADAAPESANVYLNGKDNGTTDKRLTVPAGKYEVELRREGYRTWKKTVQLEGSSIEHLVYPRLFPNELAQAVSANYDGIPSFSSQSPDRRWLVISQPGNIASLQVYDTNNPEKEPLSLVLPVDLYTNPTSPNQSLELVEWSSDNRHLLLRRIYDNGVYEFIMLDREVAVNAVNINRLLGISPSKVTLRDKKFDQLYLYDETTQQLSTVETKSKIVTPLIDGVVSYKTYGSKLILYATTDAEKPGKTIVKVWDDKKTYVLRTYDESSVLLDMAEFDGAWYVVVAHTTEGRVYVYKDPFNKIKAQPATEATAFAAMRLADPAFVSFSANTRFVAAQSGSKFAVYDFEMNRRSSYQIAGDVPATQQVRWMDGHRFAFNQAQKAVVFDFDGTNRQELTDMLPGVQPFFTRDYQRLYTLSASEGDTTKASLLRSSLKLNLKP